MAAGQTLFVWGPQGFSPPTANFAQLDAQNDRFVLVFDPSTNWSALFEAVLARNYSGNGLTLTIIWAAATATSGDVVWDVCIERQQDGTDVVTSDSFAAVQSVTATAPGVAATYKYSTVAFTSGAQMDSLAAGEAFCLKVTRNAVSGSDTMAGNAWIRKLELRETP